jgi:hypothetical protein
LLGKSLKIPILFHSERVQIICEEANGRAGMLLQGTLLKILREMQDLPKRVARQNLMLVFPKVAIHCYVELQYYPYIDMPLEMVNQFGKLI